jgi:RND family efflux transporter MFP subunit
MKKTIIIVVIASILALIGFKLARNKQAINRQNKPVDRSSFKIPVNVAEAIQASVQGTFILPAVVKPLSEAKITINASGKIKSLNFKLGSKVNKGQIIGSIDNSLKQISLQSAQLLADKQELDYKRMKELYEGKAATEVDLINAKYNYENSRTQVAQLKQQIADGNLVSPLGGVITQKNIEEGEFINVGAAAATVVDVSKLKASVMVSEKDVYRLREGLPVMIRSDVFPDKSFQGVISFINPVSDEGHNYEVEITIQNNNGLLLKGGTFIRVEFNIKGSTTALQIPKLALVEGTKNPYVYTVKDNKPVIRKVVIGRDLGENIEILDGLTAGEQVITSGQINLNETSTIDIIKNTK